MPNYECIKVETVDRVTTVTLNRPEKRNAMNPQLNNEMLDRVKNTLIERMNRAQQAASTEPTGGTI